MPDLTDFFCYSVSAGIFRHEKLAFPKKTERTARMVIQVLELYRSKMKKYLAQSRRFDAPSSIYELMKGVDDIVQLGNITGEGWFLTAEMVELIQEGVPSIACVQPFACLPNHVTGKGMIKELRRRFPGANISAIDYDPGSSEVNQLNRLKLLLSNAPAGKHPDEDEFGIIVNPDGTKTRPEVRLAAGAADVNIQDAGLLAAVPAANMGILTSVPLKRVKAQRARRIVNEKEDCCVL